MNDQNIAECPNCLDDYDSTTGVTGQSGKYYCSEQCCTEADDVPDSEDEGDYA